jgi:hypothetical protein
MGGLTPSPLKRRARPLHLIGQIASPISRIPSNGLRLVEAIRGRRGGSPFVIEQQDLMPLSRLPTRFRSGIGGRRNSL